MKYKYTTLFGLLLISMNATAIPTVPFNPNAGTTIIGGITGNSGGASGGSNGSAGTGIIGGGSNQDGDTSTHIPTDGQNCEVAQTRTEMVEDMIMEETIKAQAQNPDTFIAKLREHPSTKQCMAGFQDIIDLSTLMPQTGSITQGAIKTAIVQAVKKIIEQKKQEYIDKICTVAQSALRSSLGGLYETVEAVKKHHNLFNNPNQVIAGMIGGQIDKATNKIDGKIMGQINRLENELNNASSKVSNATNANNTQTIQDALNTLDQIQGQANNSTVSVPSQNVSNNGGDIVQSRNIPILPPSNLGGNSGGARAVPQPQTTPAPSAPSVQVTPTPVPTPVQPQPRPQANQPSVAGTQTIH